MEDGCAAPASAGLLELPPSLLHELVSSLPVKDRRALFQTCMQMAMQVLASAPNVTLRLGKLACPLPLRIRRRFISQLLATRQGFVLVVEERGPQPFRLELSRQVTEVRLEYSQAGTASSWLDWSAFSALECIHLPYYTTQTDLDRLCEALEAGRLPKLHQLRWGMYQNGKCKDRFNPDGINHARFARALGHRITALYCECPGLLKALHHLTALHGIEVNARCIPSNAKELIPFLEHPSLQTVKLIRCGLIAFDVGQAPCKWQSLHLYDLQYAAYLLRMPIANLKALHIHKVLNLGDPCHWGCPPPHMPQYGEGLVAARVLIDKHLDKVHLEPSWDVLRKRMCFEVLDATQDIIPVVRALRCDCWLVVSGHTETPMFLRALWASLHSSVSSVVLRYLVNVQCPNFWDGIPQTVNRLVLHTSYKRVECKALCSLVAKIPEHVVSLRLCDVDPKLKAAGICEAAPKHLDVEIAYALW